MQSNITYASDISEAAFIVSEAFSSVSTIFLLAGILGTEYLCTPKSGITVIIASFIFNKTSDSKDVFAIHEENIRRYYKSESQVKKILSNNSDNYVCEDQSNSTFWIYYDLFPIRLHQYAFRYNEEKFCKDVIEYIKQTGSQKRTFASFNVYLKEKGYKKAENIWFPIN